MKSLLIDTDIIIDLIRNDKKAILFLEKAEKSSNLSVTDLTIMELMIGCRNKNELSDLKKFLYRFNVIGFTELIGKKAKNLVEKYYLSHHLLIPDAINAATSITLNLPFTSKNQKDYTFIKELEFVKFN